VTRLLADCYDDPMIRSICTLLGAELEQHAVTRDLAIQVYETPPREDTTDFSMDWETNPDNRLAELYKRDNRRANARKVLLSSAPSELPTYYDEEYRIQYRMFHGQRVGSELLRLGYPADAIPVSCSRSTWSVSWGRTNRGTLYGRTCRNWSNCSSRRSRSCGRSMWPRS